MRRGLAIVLAVAVAAAWALPALSEPRPSASTSVQRLAKRVSKLERRVRALALLQLNEREPRPEVTTALGFPTHVGNGYYSGTASCHRGEVVGGGVELPSQTQAGDGPINSYPVTGGWYVFARSANGQPTIHATCVR